MFTTGAKRTEHRMQDRSGYRRVSEARSVLLSATSAAMTEPFARFYFGDIPAVRIYPELGAAGERSATGVTAS